MNDLTKQNLLDLCKIYGVKCQNNDSVKELERKFTDHVLLMKRTELLQLCRDTGVTGYSKFKKAELAKKCWTERKKSKENLTRPQLFKICKEAGITGYSKLKKDELIRRCVTEGRKITPKQEKELTRTELFKKCKEAGITGYSKLKKDELIRRCVTEVRKTSPKQEKQLTRPELFKKCKEAGITGYSRLKNEDLIKKCVNPVGINYIQRINPVPKESSVRIENLTRPQLFKVCKEAGVTGYSRLKKADLIKKCWADRKKAITKIEEKKKETILSIGARRVLTGTTIVDIVGDIATSMTGLLWLVRTYRDKVCIPIKPSHLRSPAFGRKFCDFSICWYASTKKIDWTFARNEESFWESVNDWCETRFAVVPLFLYSTTERARHFNFLFFDRDEKTVDRYEPYGLKHEQVQEHYKDIDFEKDFSKHCKNHGYTFKNSNEYCPRIGAQAREMLQKEYEHAGDPEGFCVFWSIWFADRRMKYSQMDSKKIMEKMMDQLNNISNLKKFIRDFANFISIEKRRIIQRAKTIQSSNQWSANRSVTEALLWEIIYARQYK